MKLSLFWQDLNTITNLAGPFKLCRKESDLQESAVDSCAYPKIKDNSEIPKIKRENGKNFTLHNIRTYSCIENNIVRS